MWVLLGLSAVAGVLILVLAVRTDRGRPATATVIAQRSDSTQIVVDDGGERSTWTVTWSSIEDEPVGSSGEVRMVDGEPTPTPILGLGPAIAWNVVIAALGVNAVITGRRLRGVRPAQRASLAAATEGQPVREVRAAPRFVGHDLVSSRLWLDLTDRASGAPLGSVSSVLVTPRLHPAALTVLVGEGPDGAIALETGDRRGRLLPASRLGPPPEPAPWSATLVHLLGWDATPGAEAPAVLRSTGYVSMTSIAEPDPAATRLPADVIARGQQLRRRLGALTVAAFVVAFAGIGALMVSLAGTVEILLGLGSLVIVLRVAIGLLWRSASAATARDLGLDGPDGRLVARLALSLAPDPAMPVVGLGDVGSMPVPPPPAGPPPVAGPPPG
jgi:hypothetical protein